MSEDRREYVRAKLDADAQSVVFALFDQLTRPVRPAICTYRAPHSTMYWRTREGVRLRLTEMTAEHLRNTAKLLRRREAAIVAELHRRGLEVAEKPPYASPLRPGGP